jgi:hypothetical protein
MESMFLVELIIKSCNKIRPLVRHDRKLAQVINEERGVPRLKKGFWEWPKQEPKGHSGLINSVPILHSIRATMLLFMDQLSGSTSISMNFWQYFFLTGQEFVGIEVELEVLLISALLVGEHEFMNLLRG